MRRILSKGSLARRLTIGLAVGELAFAAVFGLTMGVFGLRAAVTQRQQAMEQISSVVAAGLMPTVAGQQGSQVRAQLLSIIAAADLKDVEYLRIEDSSGSTIASASAGANAHDHSLDRQPPSVEPLSLLWREQVVEQPIIVDGLRVATVYAVFRPPGLTASLAAPAFAAGLVLVSVLLVSVPWAISLFFSTVVEPLGELQDYASRIAVGEPGTPVDTHAYGEIADLQDALTTMADQLRDRGERLGESYRELSEAYESLESANREIEQLAAVKADFVAVAAHEIRSPLATISLYSEMLKAEELGDLDDAKMGAVAAISASSARLSRIVSDLMDSALLERGLLPIEFAEVRLRDLLRRAVTDANFAAMSRGTNLGFDGSVPACVVAGDALRLGQVFDNLLSNAIKYSPEGSEVSVRAREEDGWVIVDVVDRGRGISEDDRDRLFTLFGRVDFGDSRDTAGLGLGLAISARIVEAHGGHLSFNANAEGQGSVFTVRLPTGASSAPRPSSFGVTSAGARSAS